MAEPPFAIPDNIFTDYLDHYIGTQNPTQDTFAQFGFLRTASVTIRNAVDTRLRDPVWKASWQRRAFEFVNDLAPGALLLPGAEAYAGLHRMTMTGQYAELSVGMREFLADENTQVAIMGMLRMTLTFGPFPTLQAIVDRRTNAEAAGMRRMVAQSMRYHTHSVDIQRDGCRILSYLPPPVVAMSVPLRDYVLKSLVSAMFDFPTDVILQERCLTSIESITHQLQNAPFFMLDTQNMLLVVFRCMQIVRPRRKTARVGAALLARFATYISRLVSQQVVTTEQAFAGCDITEMQTYLLRGTEKFAMDHHIVICNLMSLSYLVGVFPARMTVNENVNENEKCLAAITHALMTHAQHVEVVKFAIALLESLLSNFWCPDTGVPNTPSAKTLMPIHVIVPLLVNGLRVAPFSVTTKTICTEVFHFLRIISQNHASNAKFITDCRALDILTFTYNMYVTVPQVDHEFQVQRGLLQTVLASFPGAPAHVGY